MEKIIEENPLRMASLLTQPQETSHTIAIYILEGFPVCFITK